MSELACEVVNTTTGMVASVGSVLMSESTWRPSLRGRFRSSTTRSGEGAVLYFRSWRRNEIASAPSCTVLTWKCCLLWASTSLVKSISAGLSSTNRTSGVLIVLSVASVCRFDWKCEFEARPVTGFRFHPDPAAMPLDNLLADRQPDPVSRILFPRMQAPEDYEHAVQMFGRDADPVVLYRNHPVLRHHLRLDLNHRLCRSPKLDGIANQVLEYLRQLRPIGHHRWKLIVLYDRAAVL